MKTLTLEHCATILECILYSKFKLTQSTETPYEVRSKTIDKLDEAATRVREIRDELKGKK